MDLVLTENTHKSKTLLNKYEIKNNLIIAGGLNSNNITSLIKSYKPYGVDLASGVESKPGKKDITELKHFLKIVDEI